MPEPAVTFGWLIERLDTAPAEGGLVDVVRRIHWRLLAADDQNAVDAYGSALLPSPEPGAFVPFADLTPAAVTGWVEAAIDAAAGEDSPTVGQLRAGLTGILAAKRGPQLVPMQPPWELV
jgi:hypothetical protein